MRHCIFSLLVLAGLTLVVLTQAAKSQSPSTRSTPSPHQTDAVVIVNGSRVITEEDVDVAAGRELYLLQERIYTLRQKALDSLIDKILLEQEANTRGITVEELVRRLTSEKADVSDAEVDREYAEHGSAVALAHGTHGVEDTKRVIRSDLENKAKAQKYRAALGELRAKARIDVLSGGLEPPRVSVSDSGPSKGAKDAPITIIEFSDFQCPFCRQSQAVLDHLFKTYPDKIRLVFKQLPGPAHPQALGAAEASLCADAQGKFWIYHDKLFASDDLSRSALVAYAGQIQLNREEFEKCLDSEGVHQAVLKDVQEARKADAHATPTFVVNGQVLSGFTDLVGFEQQIDLQLTRLGRKGQ